MAVLSHLEPKRVFEIFEDICSVPHGSGNIWQVSNYCADFAKQRGLRHIQDELGNVIIFAPGTPGYEDAAPVILQGHMDMVCVKTPDCPLDLTKDGLKLAVEGDYVFARGTSLGADNGIAVAMALAVLDSADLPHPPVEVLLTVDEETGLFGAAGVDMTPMKGEKLINMDSEEEGVVTVSCAGGLRANCVLPVVWEENTLPAFAVRVEGLLGGHSGIEINRGRGNANKLMGRVLTAVGEKTPFALAALDGGTADNVIARACQTVICAADEQAVFAAAEEMEKIFKAELAGTDEGVCVVVEKAEPAAKVVSAADSARVAEALVALPQGVQSMSRSIEGLVQTSLNMGQLNLKQSAVEIRFSLRSSVTAEKQSLLEQVRAVVEQAGGRVTTDGDYPAWEYREDSPLRDLFVEVYADMYGKQPKVEAIHAGLECGLLSGKRPTLDCISIGPDLQAVHSVDEKLSVSSTRRVWELVVELLKRSR